MIFEIGASAMSSKINQEIIKKPSQNRLAFFHWFFIDFWTILAPFSEVKPTKNRSKKRSKNQPRKKGGREAAKARFWSSDTDRRTPIWPRGRVSPLRPGRPLPPGTGRCLKSRFQTIFRLPFLINVWSISSPNLAPKIDQNRPKIDAKMHSIFESNF